MYSHGDISSSMSSACVTSRKQRIARRRSRSAAAISPRSRCSVASSISSAASFSQSSDAWCVALEEQLVVVRALVRVLLEDEQLVGAQVALVVAGAGAGQHRRELVGEPGLLLPDMPAAYFDA